VCVQDEEEKKRALNEAELAGDSKTLRRNSTAAEVRVCVCVCVCVCVRMQYIVM
jgi:hypothetical protein